MKKTIVSIVLLFFVCQFAQVKAQSNDSTSTSTVQTKAKKKKGIFSWLFDWSWLTGSKNKTAESGEVQKDPIWDYASMDLEELNYRFIQASYNNDYDVMIKLLSYGANINATNTQGRTALIEASRVGTYETAKWLIDRGASVNYKDMYDGNALIYATQAGKRDIARLLVKHGARRNFDF